MSDRGNEPDFIPPYQGDPGDAAQKNEYLGDVIERCRDARNWVRPEDWEDLMNQIGAALSEFNDFPLVKNDPVIQRYLRGMRFTRSFDEFLTSYDRMATYVAQMLTRLEAKKNAGRIQIQQKTASSGRTRLVL